MPLKREIVQVNAMLWSPRKIFINFMWCFIDYIDSYHNMLHYQCSSVQIAKTVSMTGDYNFSTTGNYCY